jgi:TetR/AcrR family transcriptional repressor of nem operon
MKVDKAQVAKNRERILENASRLFRGKCYDGAGIAELMQAAGLTNGAFYGHFDSKDDLFAKVCEQDAAQPPALWAALSQDSSAAGLSRFVREYFSDAHVRGRSSGCLVAALGGDVARQMGPVRETFTAGVAAHLKTLAAAMPGPRARQNEQALSTLAALVGALILARAVDDPDLAESILESTAQDLRLRGRA